jgi:hypothetical protein
MEVSKPEQWDTEYRRIESSSSVNETTSFLGQYYVIALQDRDNTVQLS